VGANTSRLPSWETLPPAMCRQWHPWNASCFDPGPSTSHPPPHSRCPSGSRSRSGRQTGTEKLFFLFECRRSAAGKLNNAKGNFRNLATKHHEWRAPTGPTPTPGTSTSAHRRPRAQVPTLTDSEPRTLRTTSRIRCIFAHSMLNSLSVCRALLRRLWGYIDSSQCKQTTGGSLWRLAEGGL
jgi:hypothetical protein